MDKHDNFNLKDFEWLAGQWEGIQGQGIYHEEWEKINDSEFVGRAYSIKKGEISNPEKLKINLDGVTVSYTADVAHNPQPVSFTLTYSDCDKFIFENPAHDFPKIITYERKGNNGLLATIEADVNGKIKKFQFDLKKI